MRYTIHLQGKAIRHKEGKLIETLDVFGYNVIPETMLLGFWLKEENQLAKQDGFYKMDDVVCVLPIND